MRERDEKSNVNVQYKYTVLHIRMLDEIILQAIFQSNDRLSTLFDFLRSHCLLHNWLPFTLTSNADRRTYSSQDELSITYAQCGFVPAALQWNDQTLREAKAQISNCRADIFIKPEVLVNEARL